MRAIDFNRREAWRSAMPLALFSLAASAALIVAIAFAVSIGEIEVPVSDVLRAIANRIFDADYPVKPLHEGIIWDYRLSRALVAACCGAALAVSGVILQALLRNALADPYVLGISAGASTGAVLIVIAGFGGGLISLPVGAFLGAVIAFAIVALLATGAGIPVRGAISLIEQRRLADIAPTIRVLLGLPAVEGEGAGQPLGPILQAPFDQGPTASLQ